MICAPCGHDNAAQRRFCGQCGTALHAVCAHCTFQNETTDRFCGGCGDQLPASEHVLAGRSTNGPPVPHARQARPTMPATGVRALPAPTGALSASSSPMRVVAAAPVATPPAAPAAAASTPHKGRAEDLLSSSELSDLLRRPVAAAAPAAEETALGEGSITQESLDALFGG